MNRKTVPTEPSLHVQVQNVADITQKVHQKVRNVSYVDFSKDIMQASSARVWTLVGTALILVSLVLGLTAQVIALRADAESKGVHATHPDRRQAEPQAAGADQKGPEVLSQPQQKSEGQR